MFINKVGIPCGRWGDRMVHATEKGNDMKKDHFNYHHIVRYLCGIPRGSGLG